MFCSDDKHPDSLVDGHINVLCARAVKKGIDIFKIVRAACINPSVHYSLRSGMLRVGDPADFIVVEDLVSFKVNKTFIDGEVVAENGKTNIKSVSERVINQFNCSEKRPEDFRIAAGNPGEPSPVIEALDGQLITNRKNVVLPIENGLIMPDVENDILKIAVVNRYSNAPVARAFIKNIGLKRGALASSVAHDSHNIVVVGVDDECMSKAANIVIRERGGVSCVDGEEEWVVSLPVAGLMSTEDGFKVASSYTAIDAMAKRLGSTLSAPFMTLSFMALLVIPHLKLSDKGLFDGDGFELLDDY
jgi:adenine deaminase